MKSYDKIDTAVGTLYAVATSRGICAIELRTTQEEFQRLHPDAVSDGAALKPTLRLLRDFLAGRNVSLDGIVVDLAHGTEFDRAVWRELRNVPRGKTITYGKLAARVGSPRAARAVGGAMRRNPVPLIVPCHRVIRSDGNLGGFSCGTDLKEFLLEKIEKTQINDSRRTEEQRTTQSISPAETSCASSSNDTGRDRC